MSEPHNVELEQQIIGAVLINNELYHKVGGMVSKDHFFDPVHARIWSHMAGRIANDHLASPITIKSDMDSDEGLKELGGPTYLARLAGGAISSFAITDYARDLIEVAERRRILAVAREIAAGIEAGGSAADAVSGMELAAMAAAEGMSTEKRSTSLLRAHSQALEQMHRARTTGEAGISSGLKSLDELLLFKPKRSTLIAGATSMGKTSLGTWITYTAAKQGYGVAFASLEMGEEDLANRLNSIDSRVPYRVMDRPMSETLFLKVVEAAKAQQTLPIEILSDRVRDIPAILSETRRLQKQWKPEGAFKGLGMLVIDYIQLIKGRGSSFEVLSQASQAVKSISKMVDIPVVALAQVSRDMSKRESKIPHLGDLRGAGDLENDADNVIFCHRPSYYLERELQDPPSDIEEHADLEAAFSATKNVMDIIVAKQRMGPIGSCRVGCDMGTNRFWDLAGDDGQGEIDF